uniref:Uncharacterized protein n=1 Tax=Musa acuminata subsp. malaccensis TaxID=214687 RepID=A0A804JN60_MUSAM
MYFSTVAAVPLTVYIRRCLTSMIWRRRG